MPNPFLPDSDNRMANQTSPDSLRLAAQADLVALTAEMLRSPQAIGNQPMPPWFTAHVDEFQPLIEQAFGAPGPMDAPDADEDLSDQAPSPLTAAAWLKELFAELHHIASQLDAQAWSDEYWRLFDGAQACPLNQASYIRRDKGAILGDLAGFYNAFGWQPNPDNAERPDHLLSQLEFASMLLAMRATAENDEAHGIVTDALGQFHRHHMNDWLPSVCNQMLATTELEYFALVSQWLQGLWNSLSKVNAWPSDDPSEGMLSPLSDPEDPYECGACPVQLEEKL